MATIKTEIAIKLYNGLLIEYFTSEEYKRALNSGTVDGLNEKMETAWEKVSAMTELKPNFEPNLIFRANLRDMLYPGVIKNVKVGK